MKDNISKICFFLMLFVTILSSAQTKEVVVKIDGELKKWHKVTLTFNGPETSDYNPFLNFKF